MSSKYFSNTKRLRYKFGDGEAPVLYQNLSTYVDLLDQVKTESSFYQDYVIKSGERPDSLSLRLYGDDQYYWTFYMMNDKLRECGWPVANELILDTVKEKYPHRTITTKEDFTTDNALEPAFKVGQIVYGSESGTIGTILRRDPTLGQLIIDTTNTVIPLTRSITFEPNVNGYATYELTLENEKFHSPSQWRVFQDDIEISSDVEITLPKGKNNRIFEINNVNYKEGSSYYVSAEIFISNPLDNNFGEGESLYFVNPRTGLNVVAVIWKESEQYNAVHHYERRTYTAFDLDTNTNILVSYEKQEAVNAVENFDNAEVRISSEWVHIDPYTGILPAGAYPVTVRERFEEFNDDLKKIKILKKSVIERVAKEFYNKQAGRTP
jgi:hypothetical protein